MSMVCVIGAGELGGAVAHALARGRRMSRIILIDDAAGVAAGKALDIQQSGAIEGFHTRLEGTGDLSRAIGATACLIADRSGRSSTEWQGEDGLAMLKRLAAHAPEAPLVLAGTSQSDVLLSASREGHIRRERLVGSAPEALIGAIKAMVALEAGCSPSEVGLTVLGVPPTGLVVPWSDASIAGYGLERVLSQVQLSRIESRVSRLWPPGPHALGQAAARVIEALTTASARTCAVLAVLGGEFGVRNRVGVLPVALSRQGISATRVPALNTRERVRVENSLAG